MVDTKTRILVVEDEVLIARDLQRRLADLGYEVPEIAIAGEEALRKVDVVHPDLVLMDIRLKGDMDGVEVAGQIRDRYDIPVVYLTAYADEATVQRAKITQPFGYILKPFQERELQTVIEISLYRHELEKKLKEAYAQLERKVKELEGRDRLVQCQMSGPSLEEAWEEILQVVEQVLEVRKAIIYWPVGEGLEAVASLGATPGENAPDAALVDLAFREMRPQTRGAGAGAAVPILYRDEAMGVTWVGEAEEGREMDEDSLNCLWRLGQQAALLLRMARLTSDLEEGRIAVDDLVELSEEGEEDGGR